VIDTQKDTITVNPTFRMRKFDVITAWEVLEHLDPHRLQIALAGIYNHLEDDGIFLGSVSLISDAPEGIELHQIIKPWDFWIDQFQKNGMFTVEAYPFEKVYPVRQIEGSLYIMLRKVKH
jgi:cyclopropane fatty-acyl-phospholipid synthase-like methyltransferase